MKTLKSYRESSTRGHLYIHVALILYDTQEFLPVPVPIYTALIETFLQWPTLHVMAS